MSGVETPEKPSPGEGLIGCAALIGFGVYLTWPIWDRGRPASFLCLGLFLFSGACYLVAEWIKHPGKKQPVGDAPTPSPAKTGLGMRIAAGLVSGTQKAALWTAVGMALVWLLQLFLNFLPEQIGPDHASALQLFAYDLSHGLKSTVTPQRFLIVILGLLAVSTWVGSLRPIIVAGKLKKLTGIAASVLIAFSAMTFVTVQTGSARFDTSVGVIRAAIGEDLERLRYARRDKAALQWLGAKLQQVRATPDEAEAWRSYLTAAATFCETAEAEFIEGYRSARAVSLYNRGSRKCETNSYLARQTVSHLDVQPAAESNELWSWIPEWSGLRDSAQSPVPRLANVPRHFAELQSLAGRVDKSANDEERARDQVESAVTGMMSALLPDSASGAAAEVVKALRQAVLEAIYRDSRERVALWLQLREVRAPRPIEAVLGIEPGLRLTSPRAEIQQAGGIRALLHDMWNRAHRQGAETLREEGRQAAIADQEYEVQERQERVAERRRIEEFRARTTRARVR